MGYVSRLLAMSTRTPARPAPLSQLARTETAVDVPPAHDELPAAETQARSPTAARPPVADAAPSTRAPVSREASASEELSPPGSEAAESRPAVAATRTPDVVERSAPVTAAPPAVTVVGDAAPTPTAQPAAWLRENVDADDPLESIGAADDLRDVLRAVRHWTSAAPTEAVAVPEPMMIESVDVPVETSRPAAPVPAAAAVQPQNDLRVSIENVTITVEDAPASSSSRRPAGRESTTPSTRLARHYIRGT
jgi:hypothetical protein